MHQHMVWAPYFTRGRYQPQKPSKTSPPPDRLLLSDIHQLKGIYEHHERESWRSLSPTGHGGHTLPDTAPLHTNHRPRQPYILEHPRKVNRRVARWYGELQDYGSYNQTCSGQNPHCLRLPLRPFVDDKGGRDNEDVVVLPPELFITTIPPYESLISTLSSETSSNGPITKINTGHSMKAWQTEYDTTTSSTPTPTIRRD